MNLEQSLRTNTEEKGVDATAIFFLDNARKVAVQNWYESEIADIATYKLYSGTDKFHVKRDDVKKILPAEELED